MRKWKEHPTYESALISDDGQVIYWNKLQAQYLSGRGYKFVARFPEKNKSRFVHRLVAETFLDKSNDSFNVVHHKDGDQTNNRVDNLEWTNQSFNLRAAENCNGQGSARPLHLEPFNEWLMSWFLSQKVFTKQQLCKMFNVRHSTIQRITRENLLIPDATGLLNLLDLVIDNE